jgi:hypothetical protein
LQNDRNKKWFTYLRQFHIKIKYKIGISNHVTDCLSQPPVASLTTVLHSYGHETSEWPQLYKQDLDFTTTYQLLGTCTTVTDFQIQDIILCHLAHMCFPTSEHAKMILEAHYSWVVRHFGIEKTVAVLQKHFYWPKIQHDVNKYIQSCIDCTISKPTIKNQGLHMPLPIPEKLWESISMDYMSGFPSTKHGNNYVLVVVDWFSKMAILTAYKNNVIATYTTNLLFKRVWVHFGIPQTIISDRENRFLNTFWLSLWSLLDTKLTKSTSFHPQTDFQTEVVN